MFHFIQNILSLKRAGFLKPVILLLFFISASFTSLAQQVNLGEAANYGILAGINIYSDSIVFVRGTTGAGNIISNNISASDSLYSYGAGTVTQAISDLEDAMQYCNGLSGNVISSDLNGQELEPGVYTVEDNAVLSEGSPLILNGDENSIYIINIIGSLNFEAYSVIDITNVKPENIYWNIVEDCTIDEGAECYGIIMAQGNIYKNSLYKGLNILLSTNSVNLTGLDDIVGSNNFISKNTIVYLRVDATCSGVDDLNGNLILNGGFEVHARGRLNPGFNLLSSMPSDPLCNWFSGSNTPDAYHTPPEGFGYNSIPSNYFTYNQPARNNSKSYAGILSHWVDKDWNVKDWKEYIVQELVTPLTNGKHYYTEFYWVAPAGMTYAVNSLGIHFPATLPSDTDLKANNINPLMPLIGTATNMPLNQSTNWERVNGCFESNGNEKYAIIGNFDANPTVTYYPNPSTNPYGYAYHFIEDVALYEFPNAGQSQSIICGIPVTLGSEFPLPTSSNAVYSWSPVTGLSNPNILNPIANPSQTTTYTLTVTVPGYAPVVTSNATVTFISGLPQTVEAGPDIVAYQNGPTVSLTGQWPTPGLWSGDGLVAPDVNVFDPTGLNPGLYTLTYTYTNSNGCAVTDNRQVRILAFEDCLLNLYGDDVIKLEDSDYNDYTFESGKVYYIPQDVNFNQGSFVIETDAVVLLDEMVNIYIRDKAILEVNGGVITAACDKMWGGIYVDNYSEIYTTSGNRNSEISHSYNGIVMDDNIYDFSFGKTDFLHNRKSISISRGSSTRSGNDITYCNFISDPLKFKAPMTHFGTLNHNYSEANLILAGDFAGSKIEKNKFESCLFGIVVLGSDNLMINNTNDFKDFYLAGIYLQDINNSNINLGGNIFTFPDLNTNPFPNTSQLVQTASNYSFYSNPSVTNLTVGIAERAGYTNITGNTFIQPSSIIYGASSGVRQIGIQSQSSDNNILENKFENLHEGVYYITSSSAGVLGTFSILGNEFLNCEYGVRLAEGSQVSTIPEAYISCNSFIRTTAGFNSSYGIYLDEYVEAVINAPTANGAATMKNLFSSPIHTAFTHIYNHPNNNQITYKTYQSHYSNMVVQNVYLSQFGLNQPTSNDDCLYEGFDYGIQAISSPNSEPNGQVLVHDPEQELRKTTNTESPFLAQSYPNPASDNTKIAYRLPENSTGGEIIFRDAITGKSILREKLEKQIGEIHINLVSLSSGLYIYTLQCNEQLVDSKKLLIQKK